MTQQTLIIIKPDAVQRSLIGQIITRLEAKGLKIVAMKLMQISRELAEKHYGDHKGKPFFPGLIDYITSSPVVPLVVEGPNAIDVCRTLMGPTNAAQAPAGTIRGDLGMSMTFNLVHGSDSPESAAKEINLFFGQDVLQYARCTDTWLIPSRDD